MEAIIRTENKNLFEAILEFLKKLNFTIETKGGKTVHKELRKKHSATKKKMNVDAVSILSEKSLAEEWNSKEDNQWDKVL